MAADITDSIVLIGSADERKQAFGTGFVIYCDAQAAYIATCAHVVNAIDRTEDPQTIVVSKFPATLVGKGRDEFPDAAVLRVEGLQDKAPLPLQSSTAAGDAFTTSGFQNFPPHYLLRPLRGALGSYLEFAAQDRADRVPAWDLGILDQFDLQPGYSGSPVVKEQTKVVVAIVSHKLIQEHKGIAISVSVLAQVWPNMPAALLNAPAPTAAASQIPDFNEVKHRALQKQLSLLMRMYDAAFDQYMSELDEAIKIVREQNAAKYERQIKDVQQQLNALIASRSAQ